jgi:hypothetical protein
MMMCGIPDNKSNLAAKFIRKSLPYMTKNDSDGLGYVALDDNGIFGERWLNVDTAFKSRRRYTKNQENLNKFFKSAVSGAFENYTSFGKVNLSKSKTILFHTRYATNAKNMTNTHPFVIDDTALIHNGVILNDKDIMEFHENISTCDSEAILQEYIANEVSKNADDIQMVADMLDGWYACGVLTKDKDGNHIVDIFKCQNSSLYVGFVPELECFVFCTEIGILEQTAKDMRMTVAAYDEILGGKLIRMNAITGERLEIIDFKPEADKKLLSSITGKKKTYERHEDYTEWDYATEKWPAA